MEWTCALTPEGKQKYVYLIKPSNNCSPNRESERICDKAYMNHEDAIDAILDLVKKNYGYRRSEFIIENYDLCLKYTRDVEISKNEATHTL